MKIKNFSERALIEHITALLEKPDQKTIVGAGEDDCAVLDIGGDYFLLATTDMLHRKTDFPPQMSGWQIGWMSVAVNLSDVASKGAKPLGVLMAIGISPETDLYFLDDIIMGMNDCARKYGTHVIGGDMDSHDELTVAGTALGAVPKNELIRRAGANPGDHVCVTGNLGSAGSALMLLQKDIQVEQQILKALFEPVPRIKEGMALAKTRALTSMMDMSDGLALSLYDIGKASSVGFKIYEDRLPVLPAVKKLLKGDELFEAVLFTGGDFELLFTLPQEKIHQVRKACSFTIIGEVIKDGFFIERYYGTEELKSRGYGHFGKN